MSSLGGGGSVFWVKFVSHLLLCIGTGLVHTHMFSL